MSTSKKIVQKKPKKYARKQPNVVSVVYGAPQSPVIRTSCKYSAYVDFTFSVANTPYAYQFNANSVYDPDRTGTGHQPYGFDWYSLSYNRFRVFRCDYEVKFPPPMDVGNSTNEWAAMFRNGLYTVAYPDAFEMPFTKRIQVSTPSMNRSLKGSVDLTKLTERRTNYRNDDRTAGDTSTNPAEVILFIIAGLSNQANVVRLYVTLTYHVEFFDPIPLGASVSVANQLSYEQRINNLAKKMKTKRPLLLKSSPYPVSSEFTLMPPVEVHSD